MSRVGTEILQRAEQEYPQFVWRLEGDNPHMIGHAVVDGQACAELAVAMSGARRRAAEQAERQRQLDLVGEGFALWKARHPNVLAPSERELIELALFARAKGDHHVQSRE